MRCRFESTLSQVVLTIVLVFSSASVAPAQPVQETEEPASAEHETAADGEEWVVVNEDTGLRWRIIKIANDPRTYRWIDDKTVRFRGGVHFEVVDHDEDWLYVKEWTQNKRSPQPKVELDVDTRHQIIDESYRVELETVDRLEMRGFEAGLPRSGQWRHGFDVADMNEDGHLDIVFGPARKSFPPRPNIFLGDGNGHWQRWRDARFPETSYDYGDVAVGDLNGDGHQDLVFGFHLLGLLALTGDGKGGFTTWSDGIGLDPPGKGTGFSSRSIELVDWNGDGRLDIFAFGEGPKQYGSDTKKNVFGAVINTALGLMVFVNEGDGTWTPQRPSSDEAMLVDFGDDFALGDLNHDQRLDVVKASSRIASTSVLGFGSEDGLKSDDLDPLRVRALIGAVEIADLDGDGGNELVLGYLSHETDQVRRTGIDIYRRKSEAEGLQWDRRPLYVTEVNLGVYGIDTGDVDGDGRVDVVALSGEGEVWVFLADGHGGFVREASPELPRPVKGCRGYEIRLIDLDGDGGNEIIAAFAGEESGLQLPEFFRPGCEGQGSVRAWKAVPIPASDPGASPASTGQR